MGKSMKLTYLNASNIELSIVLLRNNKNMIYDSKIR